jgi:hypothetical protein
VAYKKGKNYLLFLTLEQKLAYEFTMLGVFISGFEVATLSSLFANVSSLFASNSTQMRYI